MQIFPRASMPPALAQILPVVQSGRTASLSPSGLLHLAEQGEGETMRSYARQECWCLLLCVRRERAECCRSPAKVPRSTRSIQETPVRSHIGTGERQSHRLEHHPVWRSVIIWEGKEALYVTAFSLSVSFLRAQALWDNRDCNKHDTNEIEFTRNWVLSWLLCVGRFWQMHSCL